MKDRNWIAKAVLEVVLISTGVFLGLAAEQWRSDAQHRDQARAALQRFKVEMEANQAAVKAVIIYHADIRKQIGAYLDPKLRPSVTLKMQGLKPVNFEHTAWDLVAFLHSVKVYLDDILSFDPGMVTHYERVLPMIDRALTP